ncbi:MAG: CDP-glycerol glycerophosphotransferase family protein [Oscillospiraceae bacterium]|nr:CDP-glycerol glycerophosphotransferase family protein [Clostridiales bacterium]
MNGLIKHIISSLLYTIPGKKYIILESSPPMSDNTGAVFRKMIEQHWNAQYKLLWVVDDPEKFRSIRIHHVSFAGTRTSLQRLRLFFNRCRAAAIVDCNGQIKKLNPRTVHLYLTHGSPIKSIRNYYTCDETTDWILSQASFFRDINAEEFHIDPQKLITLGFPRNDQLFSTRANLKAIFGDEFDRFVVWYPTYRQHKNDLVRTTDISIPVIHDPAVAQAINHTAAELHTLIVVKPHPAQDLSKIQALSLSNIRFIDDSLFSQYDITSYEFLAQSDALITDYSSVFFDYLLTDKPIGLTFEDYEAYAQSPGFAIDTELLRACAEMLDTPADFTIFLEQIASGEDPFFAQRSQLKYLTNQYTDNRSAQRVLDFLAEQIEKKEQL